MKLSRGIQVFFYTSLSILAVGISASLFYLWQSGSLSEQNLADQVEASMQLESFENQEVVKSIKNLVESDRIRESVKLSDDFSKSLEKVFSVSPSKTTEAQNLKKSLNELQISLGKLISYPELSKIILVFGQKMASFEGMVVSNNWRTLTRISKRISAKLRPSKVQTPGFFSLSRLERLHNSVTKDITMMEKVTKNSVLSRENKNLIITKIKTLSGELEMLSNYLNDVESFYNKHETLTSDYQSWKADVGPVLGEKRISFSRNSQMILLGGIFLVGFLLFCILGGYFLFTKASKKLNRDFEDLSLNLVKNEIVPYEDNLADSQFSREFIFQIKKHKEYIHKRMSFGSIFAEATPFSALLLDSNLKMVWGNNLFYETWKIDKQTGESLTWDFLQKSTNLGEDDPVALALKQGIAGIYQIQIRIEKETLPYEMYVYPVDYGKQKRVMIFLYPLRSIEETLSHQTRSIVNPVVKTLDNLMNDQYNQEFKEDVFKDFEAAGITEIYSRFEKFHHMMKEQKRGLLGEIERLENDLLDQHKNRKDIFNVADISYKKLGQTMRIFEESKENIIHCIDQRYRLETHNQETLQTAKDIYKVQEEIFETAKEAASMIEENSACFKSVSEVRTRFKQVGEKISNGRSQMIQGLDQLLVFLKRKGGDHELEKGLSRLKMDIKNFDKTLSAFNDTVKSVDVSLSKIELMKNEYKGFNFESLNHKLSVMKERLENENYAVQKVSRDGEMADEQVVYSMKSFFENFEDLRVEFSNLKRLSKDLNIEEIEKEVSEFKTSDETNGNEEILI